MLNGFFGRKLELCIQLVECVRTDRFFYAIFLIQALNERAPAISYKSKSRQLLP